MKKPLKNSDTWSIALIRGDFYRSTELGKLSKIHILSWKIILFSEKREILYIKNNCVKIYK